MKNNQDSNTKAVSMALAKLLADEYVLLTKTRNAHWNIEGTDFYAMHKFFEAQYEALDGVIDDVAERIRTQGHYAPATLKEFLSLTHLTERSSGKNSSRDLIKELQSDHDSIINYLKEISPLADKYKDPGSGDFIIGLLKQHEKMAWMLKAHLK